MSILIYNAFVVRVLIAMMKIFPLIRIISGAISIGTWKRCATAKGSTILRGNRVLFAMISSSGPALGGDKLRPCPEGKNSAAAS